MAVCPVALLSTPPPAGCASQPTLAIARSHYLDKVRGWWMGKIVGVTLGGPYEFSMPWPPREVTGYVFDSPQAGYFGDNDDLYVGMTYLLALDRRGPSLTQGQMAEEFLRRLEPRRLWLANLRAYMNLAAGLGPPKTGHPVFNGGVAVNGQMQPCAAGAAIYSNLWAAGGALASVDPIQQHSLEGIAIATGVAAGQAIVRSAQ